MSEPKLPEGCEGHAPTCAWVDGPGGFSWDVFAHRDGRVSINVWLTDDTKVDVSGPAQNALLRYGTLRPVLPDTTRSGSHPPTVDELRQAVAWCEWSWQQVTAQEGSTDAP